MGNPIAPVLKISSNTQLAEKMNDIIDVNAGEIISGTKSINDVAEDIINYIIEVASGRIVSKADQQRQDVFIPWKRGVSL